MRTSTYCEIRSDSNDKCCFSLTSFNRTSIILPTHPIPEFIQSCPSPSSPDQVGYLPICVFPPLVASSFIVSLLINSSQDGIPKNETGFQG